MTTSGMSWLLIWISGGPTAGEQSWGRRWRCGTSPTIRPETLPTYIDETRRDTSIDLDAEVSYVFWTREGVGQARVVVEGWWDKQVSNMEYEETIATNTESYGILAGVSVDLP